MYLNEFFFSENFLCQFSPIFKAVFRLKDFILVFRGFSVSLRISHIVMDLQRILF